MWCLCYQLFCNFATQMDYHTRPAGGNTLRKIVSHGTKLSFLVSYKCQFLVSFQCHLCQFLILFNVLVQFTAHNSNIVQKICHFSACKYHFGDFFNLVQVTELTELSSIALAHFSQYFSIIIAPSVLYLTNFVAGSPHPIQNLEFFSMFDVKGSILFNVFSNNHNLL